MRPYSVIVCVAWLLGKGEGRGGGKERGGEGGGGERSLTGRLSYFDNRPLLKKVVDQSKRAGSRKD